MPTLKDSSNVMGYVGWELPKDQRDYLMRVFMPRFSDIRAHHVTLAYGVPESALLPIDKTGVIVAEVFNEGVQALVIEIAGTTVRPDGSHYHITWSLDKQNNFESKMSNTLLKERGFVKAYRIPIQLTPKFFPMGIAT